MDDHLRAALKRALERWAVPMDGCLIWTGSAAKARDGAPRHPHITTRGRNCYVRRLLWQRDHGPIPEGMTVRTTCGQDCCVAPEHLVLAPRGYSAQERTQARGLRPQPATPPERICVECGRPFTPESGNRVLCSEECRVTRARRIDRERKRRKRAKEHGDI